MFQETFQDMMHLQKNVIGETEFYQKYPYLQNRFTNLKRYLETTKNATGLIIHQHSNQFSNEVKFYDLFVENFDCSYFEKIGSLIFFSPVDDENNILFENSVLIFNNPTYDYFFNKIFLEGHRKSIAFHEKNNAFKEANMKNLMFSSGLIFDFYKFVKEDIDKYKKENNIYYPVNAKLEYCYSFYNVTNRDIIPTENSLLIKLSNDLMKGVTINDLQDKSIKQDVLTFWNSKTNILRFELIAFFDYFIKKTAELKFKPTIKLIEELYVQNFV